MSVLADIVAGVQQDVKLREQQTPFVDLIDHIPEMPPALPVLDRLKTPGQVALIAEIKRSSPSKGALAPIPDPAALAQQYQAGGASVVSVLTEGRRFGGSLADLNAVRRAVTIPVLRKDFIVSPYQLYESRAYGADMLLLIVAALPGSQLISFLEITEQLGMSALVEIHTADELNWAVQAGAKFIGINARNLKTLDVDTAVFSQLAELVPEGVVRIAESGVQSPADVSAYAAAGADAVLVGEALVTAPDAQLAVADLLAAGRKDGG